MEYDVSLLGGYSDEEEISQDITEMLLVVMQVVVMKMDAIGFPIWMCNVTNMNAMWMHIRMGHVISHPEMLLLDNEHTITLTVHS